MFPLRLNHLFPPLTFLGQKLSGTLQRFLRLLIGRGCAGHKTFNVAQFARAIQQQSLRIAVMEEETIEIPEDGQPEDNKNTCKDNVLVVFEDICPQHLDELAGRHASDSDAIIATILDQQERGVQYPRRNRSKKRKRDDDDGDKSEDQSSAIKARIDDPEYHGRMRHTKYKDMATLLISQDFPTIPKNTIRNKLLAENGSSVFRTYNAIDDAIRTWDDASPAWQPKKAVTKPIARYSRGTIADLPRDDLTAEEKAALDEFLAARDVKTGKDAEQEVAAAELLNVEQAKANREMAECGCCFEEFPLNRMVHCEGEDVHWFCRGCMKQQAETTIGYAKYELTCLSMDGCTSGFSTMQRRAFLDTKLQIALDRIEQQAMLQMAGIENLESCPFCPFAMEYPPVEENKEFRCANSDCEIISCRLCRKKTHIPKTCAEAAVEEGHSARHTIEEAMSEAVIRKCNKCSNPFIKQDGCNKMMCTRCRTIQCYVCRQTVQDYTHFNDANRGGKQGQCPLFDSTEERHQNEVRHAEEETRAKVAKDNPELVIPDLPL
ncbi:ring finger protein [Xylariales sp. AK1849]|nr:ring finger protein [Xylariales sp. AK1849]